MECEEMISELLEQRLEQEQLDKLYERYVETYHSEMSLFYREIDRTPNSKRAAKHTNKAYWSEELTQLWRVYHEAEKLFVKTHKHDPRYRQIKFSFTHKRRSFDRTLRKIKRSYERKKVYDLERANTGNPKEFWRTIANLGPKKKSKIPWEVYCESGETSDDFDVVMNTWKESFEGLLKAPPPETEQQKEFLDQIRDQNQESVNSWSDDNVNKELNKEFSKSEVARIIDKAKKGKAPGIDGIVSDTLNNLT